LNGYSYTAKDSEKNIAGGFKLLFQDDKPEMMIPRQVLGMDPLGKSRIHATGFERDLHRNPFIAVFLPVIQVFKHFGFDQESAAVAEDPGGLGGVQMNHIEKHKLLTPFC